MRTIKVKYISKIIAGQSPLSEDVNLSGTLPFLQGCADFGNRVPFPKKYCEKVHKIAPKGAWLISVRAPVGELNYADQCYGIGRGLVAIIPKNICSRFFGYALLNSVPELNKVSTGSTYDAVSSSQIGSLFLKIPSDETQKEIADFLDSETARIDTLIEKKEKLISLMKERETNAINEKFSQLKEDGCSIWKLGHVCRVQRGKFTHRPRNAPELYDGDSPFIQTGDVARAEKFITQHKQTLSELGISVSAKFPANTLLMAIAANVGNVAITTYEVYCPDSVVGFIPSKKIKSEYLYYTLRAISDDISSSSTSNAQDNTNVARLSNLKISLPTLLQQEEMIESFKKREELLFKTISVVLQSIDKLKAYKNALITEAVTGQLDIKAWKNKGGTDKSLDVIQEKMAS